MNYQLELINWDRALKEFGCSNATLIYVSGHCTDIRIYEENEVITKIRRITLSSSRRRINTLLDEFIILKNMNQSGINNIPEPINYSTWEDFEAIQVSKIDEIKRNDPTLKIKEKKIFSTWKSMLFIMHLNSLGYSHGDIHAQNIGVNIHGKISCFDFDQSIQAKPFYCFLRDFFKITIDGCASQYAFIDRFLYNQVLKINNSIRKKLGLSIKAKNNPLDNFQERCEVLNNPSLNQLSEAWKLARESNASNPGVLSAYYSLDISGIHFPGQRPWPLRWQYIEEKIDFSGKKFLELGCNMGLLSIHAKMMGAEKCHGVDIDSKITKAAILAAKAFNVDVSYSNLNFDSPENWEDRFDGYNFVSCLSVFYWIKNKDRFSRFLSRFNEILFEGHATGTEDIDFVKSLGFTTVQTLTLTERNRPLIYGIK